MKIKILVDVSLGPRIIPAGKIIDISETDAKRLVRKGFAKEVKETKSKPKTKKKKV